MMSVSAEDFGFVDLQDRLRAFCRLQGLELPRFWVFEPNGVMMCWAVSMHLNGKDRWEEFEAAALFMLRSLDEIGDLDALENRLRCMFEDFGEPVVLTIKVDESQEQQRFFKGIGMMHLPVTWEDDNETLYEVYAKGQLEMGGLVNLMERIEYIGKELVYKR